MPQGKHPIIFINNTKENLPYTPPQSGGEKSPSPQRDRRAHGYKILQSLENSWKQFQGIQSQRSAVSATTRDGIYLEFRSSAGFELVTKSLENIQKGIRLLNIKSIPENDKVITIATVYIPAGKETYFISKVQAYLNEETKEGTPKNARLINSIEDVTLAIFESFWQDKPHLIPKDHPEWCEVWLRTEDKNRDLTNFSQICQQLEIETQYDYLFFPERTVTLVKANRDRLTELLLASDQIAEYRKARDTVRFFMECSNTEQTEWVEDLLRRMDVREGIDTSICILDTGINNGHQLISPVLSDDDMHSYSEDWGVHDHDGHGTNMSGVAIFGSLSEALQSNDRIEIKHIIESGKILPPKGENDPRLYGYITQQVVSKAEIQAPDRKRIICMAVTTHEFEQGKPSSWSGAIDALSSGAADDVKRLIILAAGNVLNDWHNYTESNEVSSVHSPSQSWNAISVGAYTDLTQITDPRLSEYSALAPQGGLSPYSSTSLTWKTTKWPIKPDVLFEGGNVAIHENNDTTECDDLSVLTTHFRPGSSQFVHFRMTSAATAKAAWMAAQIQAQYPNAWPETIRGLLIHSANWTQTMRAQFLPENANKANYRNLIRACGYGVPRLENATYCTNNHLVLIAQETLQPFDKYGSSYKTKDMHFHELPWPKEVLLALENTPVKLKVTLSYFIEPGPGEVGWKDKYRYRSHGLKFDVNLPSESKHDFIKRINRAAREEKEEIDSNNDSQRWVIGSQNRHLGSVHADFIEGTAAEIASCNFIGIYPVIGWWKQRQHLMKWDKKTRYSLIVSLETPIEEVDLYSSVAISLQIPIEVSN